MQITMETNRSKDKRYKDMTGYNREMQKKRAISLFSTVAPAMILYPMDDTRFL